MAFTWRVEEGGKEDLSHDENVQSGQMWVQLFWECSFEKGLKGGKEKHFIYLVIYSLNKFLFSTYLS